MDFKKQSLYTQDMINAIKHAYEYTEKRYRELDNHLKSVTIFPGLDKNDYSGAFARLARYEGEFLFCKELYDIVLNNFKED